MAGVMFRSWPWRMTVLPARTLACDRPSRLSANTPHPATLAASGLGGASFSDYEIADWELRPASADFPPCKCWFAAARRNWHDPSVPAAARVGPEVGVELPSVAREH